jgi:hypothetical protein
MTTRAVCQRIRLASLGVGRGGAWNSRNQRADRDDNAWHNAGHNPVYEVRQETRHDYDTLRSAA